MSTTIPTVTVTHRIGQCPTCRCTMRADVDVEVIISTPQMSDSGAVVVNASPRIVGTRIEHRCWRDDDGEVHHGERAYFPDDAPTTTNETRTA